MRAVADGTAALFRSASRAAPFGEAAAYRANPVRRDRGNRKRNRRNRSTRPSLRSACRSENSATPLSFATTISPSIKALRTGSFRSASATASPNFCRPIEAAAGPERDLAVFDMGLKPIAVELDLVQPSIAGWGRLRQRRQHWLDKAGQGDLAAHDRRLPRRSFAPARLRTSVPTPGRWALRRSAWRAFRRSRSFLS